MVQPLAKKPSSRRQVIFRRTTKKSTATTASCCSLPTRTKKMPTAESAESVVDEEFNSGESTPVRPAIMIPDLFTSAPPVRDPLVTITSTAQDSVMEVCLSHLSPGEDADLRCNDYGLPGIDRPRHARFLRHGLGTLPAPYVAMDTSRPWYLYWSLNALALLGEDVSGFTAGVVETVRSMQNASGGFGAGHGQDSHLATTYAVLLALAITGDEEAFRVVDRRAMWRWLCSLKQADGGFLMAVGGEEDVRGAYCAAVIISLLNLPLDLSQESEAFARDPEANLFTRLGEYVRRCQTFEGGISGSPDAEAHGAYAFCALACLSILGTPDQTIPRYLDVPRLIAWLSSRQYAPEGGFSGRTNKLVDGCYSHWVGGCWPLIAAYLGGPAAGGGSAAGSASQASVGGSLFSREGLIRYIHCCCQDQNRRGGLRDKPGKPSDAYHTNYVLSGLSSAENRWQLVFPSPDPNSELQSPGGPAWVVSPYLDYEEGQLFNEEDRIAPVHPIYVIQQDKADGIQAYFAALEGF